MRNCTSTPYVDLVRGEIVDSRLVPVETCWGLATSVAVIPVHRHSSGPNHTGHGTIPNHLFASSSDTTFR